MMDVRRILCAVDFSETSRRAAHAAAELGRKLDARITLLHVLLPVPERSIEGIMVRSDGVAPTLRASVDADLEAWRRDVASWSGVVVDTRVTTGDAAADIARVAGEGYDLVVMGTHGRTGMSRVLMGSVAELVVRKSPCPTLTVGPSRTRSAA